MALIEETIGRAALFEQLAEEAIELAHAALKQARILRGENPTPMTQEKAAEYVLEEYSDVVLCAKILELQPSEEIMSMKRKRWIKRLLENSPDEKIQKTKLETEKFYDYHKCEFPNS